MKKYTILVLVLLFGNGINSKPLPAKLGHTIIIDTDCAIDDMRAISLILSRPEILVKAILLTDGTLTPKVGTQKVVSLLHEFKCDSIPVVCGDTLSGINPPWREFNEGIRWAAYTDQRQEYPVASKFLSEILRSSVGKTTIVCLGPLTNIALIIQKEASLKTLIEKIIWYNDGVKPMQGFNYECDKNAVATIIKSGIRIDIISNLHKSDMVFNTSYYELCKQANSHLAKILSKVNEQPAVLEKIQQGHFKLNDDLVAIYLTNPELFDMNPMIPEVNVRFTQDYNSVAVNEVFADMIKGQYVAGRDIVFNSFPMRRELFTYDVRQVMDSAISRYGYDEWKANVMTDEFHGHLGVFSIVGAKMGIKARELFGVGPDLLEVISYAGTKPPYSCLNDGIQVSVGATLGMGTIQVSGDSITQPMADFTYKGRSIRIKLKAEYLEKVDADINEGIVKFGLMDDGYWKLIRRNALKYWVEWDRNKIFDIQELRYP
jgi:inosine-uridine nucleoside N-ribohydrolase/formylmethanofuran dehydrogenase subunit E